MHDSSTKCNMKCKIIVVLQRWPSRSAAKGVLHRRGAGRIKHLEAKQLWAQDLIMNKKLIAKKVAREINPSDAFTHYWSAKDVAVHFQQMGIGY